MLRRDRRHKALIDKLVDQVLKHPVAQFHSSRSEKNTAEIAEHLRRVDREGFPHSGIVVRAQKGQRGDKRAGAHAGHEGEFGAGTVAVQPPMTPAPKAPS